MTRRPLNLLTALSLLLFVATVALWVRSSHTVEIHSFSLGRGARHGMVYASAGPLLVG